MAITKNERRFLRHWEEQRKGSKAGYYAMYIAIWFFTTMLCLFFVMNNFIDIKRNRIGTLYLMIGISVVISAAFTHITYLRNEKKFKSIINREVDGDTGNPDV